MAEASKPQCKHDDLLSEGECILSVGLPVFACAYCEIERLTEALAASEGYLSYERSQVERLTRERDDAQKLAESLQNKWASRPLSYPDSDALIAENDKLRAALENIRDDRVIQGMSSALFAEKILRDAP